MPAFFCLFFESFHRIFAINDKAAMAFHKKEAFSIKEQLLATYAKALSHPARIAILQVLAKRKECICGEIVEILPLAQSTVSRHLKELKEAGLIKGTISGPRSCYCINHAAFVQMEKLMGRLMKTIHKNATKQCC